MTISFIGSASAEADSLTLPTHQAGDLIICFGTRADSGVAPFIPTGWTSCGNGAGLNSDAYCIGYKIADSSSMASDTWTNSQLLVACVYRETDNYLFAGYRAGNRSTIGGTSAPNFRQKAVKNLNTVSFTESERMVRESGIVIGLITSPSIIVDLSPPPSGMTNRLVVTGTTSCQIAVHDTGSPVNNFNSANATLSAATPWLTAVFDVNDSGIPKSGSGGGGASFPPIGPGGLVY